MLKLIWTGTSRTKKQGTKRTHQQGGPSSSTRTSFTSLDNGKTALFPGKLDRRFLRGLRRLATVVALSCAGLAVAQTGPQSTGNGVPPGLAAPRVVAADARLPIQIAKVLVEAEIVGGAALTRVELELRNPNERVLEGELQFPLRAGQTVTGFALDIEGQLRPAVGVEKAKGQQVFEDVIRAKVDPALLEVTAGNSYKLRVYPLPAHGSRRITLDITETLARSTQRGAKALTYQLPLQFGPGVQQLDVRVRLPGSEPRRVQASIGATKLPVTQDSERASLIGLTRSSSDARASSAGEGSLKISIGVAPGQSFVSTAPFADASYFYADIPAALQTQPRPRPQSLAILWDASASGAVRDHAREFALLDAYFRAVQNVDVQLQVVRDAAQPLQDYVVSRGEWPSLRAALEKTVYDGATNLGAFAVPANASLALLFSDGLGDYGSDALRQPGVPLYTVNAAANAAMGADAVLLRHAAESSGGTYLDLSLVSAAEGARALQTAHTRIVALRSADASELVSESAFPQAGRLVVAGKLNAPAATIEIDVEAPDGSRTTRKIAVSTDNRRNSTAAVAPSRWAALTLATLEADHERNRAAIRRLGMKFGLPTSETSLIVLDAVSDYVRHEIEPPAALRADYERQLAIRKTSAAADNARHIDRVVDRFKDKQAWWDKDFPKDTPPPKAPSTPAPGSAGGTARVGAAPPAPTMAMPPPPAPPPVPAPSPAPRVAPAAASATAGNAGTSAAPQPATIRLRKWEPNAPYVTHLRDAKPENMYAAYLDERGSYTASTAFYLDAADIFIDRGETDLGLRILSNLAEMNLENRHILRILAYRLVQARQFSAALPILRKIQRLSPDEPQSYRDLGLALAEDGQNQAAIEQLWRVVSRPWAQRFPDVELIALAELNAIVARNNAAGKPALDTSAMDARLLRNLPLDVRTVLTWDADNTDIDLWVIDPNGEKVFYGQPLSYQGGRVSKDFTAGYGPEEFSLRHAKPGTYTVKAKFYGHVQQLVAPATTLMLQLSTGFGTAAQKDESVVLRLSGKGDEVTVGTFTVDMPEQKAAHDAERKADLDRAYKQKQYEESNAGVHAQHAAEAPARNAQARWGETHHPWKILVFHAFRPGILSMCRDVHRWPDFERLALPDPKDPLRARWLTEAASIRWSGGSFAKGGDAPQKEKLLTDACFALYVDNVPVLSGAIVPSFSARLLEFPTLVVERPAPGAAPDGPLALTLAPGFPAEPRQPVSPEWRALLNKISGPD